MVHRSPLSLLLVSALSSVAMSTLFYQLFPSTKPPQEHPTRIVSLSPAITETLVAIGAEDRLVGRSDFCDHPESVQKLPALGTALKPSPELIVRVDPDHIVVSGSTTEEPVQLSTIAPTTVIPWLSLADVTAGIRSLGALTGHQSEADHLAMELAGQLDVPAAKVGPRLLLVFGMPQGNTIWYVKRNSLHGRAIHAVGWRNAVDEVVDGPATLSFERLIEINPELIVLMIARDNVTDAERENHLDVFRRFPMLQAVQKGGLGVIAGSSHYRPGPRILDFVRALREEVGRLTKEDTSEL